MPDAEKGKKYYLMEVFSKINDCQNRRGNTTSKLLELRGGGRFYGKGKDSQAWRDIEKAEEKTPSRELDCRSAQGRESLSRYPEEEGRKHSEERPKGGEKTLLRRVKEEDAITRSKERKMTRNSNETERLHLRQEGSPSRRGEHIARGEHVSNTRINEGGQSQGQKAIQSSNSHLSIRIRKQAQDAQTCGVVGGACVRVARVCGITWGWRGGAGGGGDA